MSYKKSYVKVLDSLTWYDLVSDQYNKYRNLLNSFYNLDFNRFVDRNKKLDIIDLWSWDGRLWSFLSKLEYWKYFACDISSKMLEKHPKVTSKLIFDLNEKFPLESDLFDLAVSFFVLEHLDNLNNFFFETYRILRSWWSIVIWYFLQRREFVWKLKSDSFKIKLYKYKVDEIKKVAENNFFKVLLNPVYDKGILSWYIIVCEKP